MSLNLQKQGIEAIEQGDYLLGRDFLIQALMDNPELDLTWHYLGSCFVENSDRILCYQKALSINPDLHMSQVKLYGLQSHESMDIEYNDFSKEETHLDAVQQILDILNDSKVRDREVVSKPKNGQTRLELEDGQNIERTVKNGEENKDSNHHFLIKLLIALLIGLLLGLIMGVPLLTFLVKNTKVPVTLADNAALLLVNTPIIETSEPLESTAVPIIQITPALQQSTQELPDNQISKTPDSNINDYKLIKDTYVQIKKAWELDADEKYVEAILIYDELILQNPNLNLLYNSRAYCYTDLYYGHRIMDEAQGYLEKAYEDVSKSIALQPTRGESYFQRAEIAYNLAWLEVFYMDQKYYFELSLADYLKAFELGTSEIDVRWNIGYSLLLSGHHQEGFDLLLSIEESANERTALHSYYLAKSYMYFGEFEDAWIYMFQTIIEDGFYNNHIDSLRIRYYTLQKEEFFEWLNSSIEDFPSYGGYRYYMRALLHYENGDSDLALADLDYGFMNVWLPYNLRAYLLGKIALEEGFTDEAIYWFQLAEASLDPILDKPFYEESQVIIKQLGGEPLFENPGLLDLEAYNNLHIQDISKDKWAGPDWPYNDADLLLGSNYKGFGVFHIPDHTEPSRDHAILKFRPLGFPQIGKTQELKVRLKIGAFPQYGELKISSYDQKFESEELLFVVTKKNHEDAIEISVPEPNRFVDENGFLFIGLKNTGTGVIRMNSVQVQLTILDENGAEVIIGYED
ncbi:MAG: tetratricopeptide repeat protein [Anaerolineaceae bacterium]|nr:tetratricopeptide repeat protein [Anaerolineaceae bacterium]